MCENDWDDEDGDSHFCNKAELYVDEYYIRINTPPDFCPLRKNNIEVELSDASLTTHETTPEKEYKQCGGCGAKHPSKRCIGCMHDF